ncbi:hypothetical protein BSKO_05974 [Bryopsis sp. KO-2023]|nr:hypothetical protein BSKO_05974 [Bryopsis sp. KO-2023]
MEGSEVESRVGCLLNAAIVERRSGQTQTDLWEKLMKICARMEPMKRAGAISQAVLRYSAAMVDTLPKKMAAVAEVEAFGFGDKMTKHNLLLECLASGECFYERRIDMDAVCAIFEHQEKVYSVSYIWSFLEDLGKGKDFEDEGKAFKDLIVFAGDSCRRTESEFEKRYDGWDLFFARPSISILALMQTISIESQRGRDGAFNQEVMFLSYMHLLLKEVCNSGSVKYRSSMSMKFPSTSMAIKRIRKECWTAGREAREARCEILRAGKRLYARGKQSEEDDFEMLQQLMEEVTVDLLDSYQCAISFNNTNLVKDNLMESYIESCNSFLGWIVLRAKRKLNSNEPEVHESGMKSIRMALELAKKHYAFQQLFDICEILEDRDLLHENMTNLKSRPELHNQLEFSRWVFQHLKAEKRLGDLFNLPNSFDEELLKFLAPFPDLLWRIQVRTGQIKKSLTTLTMHGRRTPNSAEARHALSLAALAAKISYGDADSENEALRFKQAQHDSILGLARLKAQDAIKSGPAPLMPSEAVIEAVLENADRCETATDKCKLLDRAIDVFSKSDPSFRENQYALWERMWRCILNAEDWENLDPIGFIDSRGLERMAIHRYLTEFRDFMSVSELNELMEIVKKHKRWDINSSKYIEFIFRGVFGVELKC